MLTFLLGTDTKSRDARLATYQTASTKKGAQIRIYTDVSFDCEEILVLAKTPSLFGDSFFVMIRGIADDASRLNEFENIMPELVSSAHTFIFVDTVVSTSFLKKIQKLAVVVESFDEKKKEKKPEVFNVFLLTDAFSNRKRTQAWALYRHALALGLEPRELHSKLFWAVKTLLVARQSTNAIEAGLHPFVFGKSKKSSELFKKGELEQITIELAKIFHETQFGAYDLETKLESFILRALA